MAPKITSIDPNKAADLALWCTLVPILPMIIGVVVIARFGGWEAIAIFYFVLMLSAILCTVPIILSLRAFDGHTDRKEKALTAILLPILSLFGFYVTFGGAAFAYTI